MCRLSNSFDRVFYTTDQHFSMTFYTNASGTATGWEVHYTALPNALTPSLWQMYNKMTQALQADGNLLLSNVGSAAAVEVAVERRGCHRAASICWQFALERTRTLLLPTTK